MAPDVVGDRKAGSGCDRLKASSDLPDLPSNLGLSGFKLLFNDLILFDDF